MARPFALPPAPAAAPSRLVRIRGVPIIVVAPSRIRGFLSRAVAVRTTINTVLQAIAAPGVTAILAVIAARRADQPAMFGWARLIAPASTTARILKAPVAVWFSLGVLTQASRLRACSRRGPDSAAVGA